MKKAMRLDIDKTLFMLGPDGGLFIQILGAANRDYYDSESALLTPAQVQKLREFLK
jgi:hypothetical protein